MLLRFTCYTAVLPCTFVKWDAVVPILWLLVNLSMPVYRGVYWPHMIEWCSLIQR